MQESKPSRTAILFLFVAWNCPAAQLSPSAEKAFQRYAATVETRLVQQHAKPETYLSVLKRSLQRKQISDEIYVEAIHGGTWPVDGALIHHWRGAAYLPKATPRDMFALLRDFHHSLGHYAPEVVSSHALTDNGQTATLAVRFKEQKVLTIVLDAEFAVDTKLVDEDRGYSVSRSTHIWEVDNPGTADERRRPEGNDDGFLWHLNSYWSFSRANAIDESYRPGLFIECEAISLTRDIPVGLGWLISPIVAGFPRELLGSTLRSTKKALLEKIARENNE